MTTVEIIRIVPVGCRHGVDGTRRHHVDLVELEVDAIDRAPRLAEHRQQFLLGCPHARAHLREQRAEPPERVADRKPDDDEEDREDDVEDLIGAGCEEHEAILRRSRHDSGADDRVLLVEHGGLPGCDGVGGLVEREVEAPAVGLDARPHGR